MTTPCPTCGARVSGKFCSECGSPLAGAACVSCSAALTPGARFCHRCGVAVLTPPVVIETATPTHSAQGLSNALPWAVAAIAILSLIALAAGQRFAGATRPATATSAAATTAGAMTPRAPDISSLTPLERAERLYERIMGAAQRGRADTVRFFMPMAVQAYRALAPMTIDQRYDLGRLGEVAGDASLAAAQADTILREQPQHLLGLVLAYRAARLRRDQPAMQGALDRLARVADQERQKQLPEYLLRQADIDSAVAQSKRR